MAKSREAGAQRRKSNLKITVERIAWRDVSLGVLKLRNGGRMRLTLGVGSGLAQRRGDPSGTLWAIADRGPNLKVDTAVERYGLSHLAHLADLDGAKLMPRPDLGPTLCELKLEGKAIKLVRQLRLGSSNGRPLSGLPALAGNAMEPAFDLEGNALGVDPSGADTEGVVALSNGTFWIAEEFGPSLLHVDAEGKVLRRWVPRGIEKSLTNAGHPVHGVLPAIAARRRLNRGFEALALSPDERWLYLIFQSPLAHPEVKVFKRAQHVRVWKLELATGVIAAQFLYPLDKPSSFARDQARGDVDRSDIKVSEAVTLGDGELLVLERISYTTKIYRVALEPKIALPKSQIDPRTRPTLEQMSADGDLPETIPVLAKSLVLSSDDFPALPRDLEGMEMLSPTELLLVNDNDFSVEGARTQFWRVKVREKLL